MKAIWLLDVDGVINASRAGWSAAPRTKTALEGGLIPWKIRFAPQLVRRIRVLHESGLVEVQWCTTWCPDATQLEHMFGFPALARALSDADASAKGEVTRSAKVAAALAVLADGRRLVWTDDDAIPELGPERAELDAAGALLIAPRANRGLRPEHLEQIETFLRSNGAPSC